MYFAPSRYELRRHRRLPLQGYAYTVYVYSYAESRHTSTHGMESSIAVAEAFLGIFYLLLMLFSFFSNLPLHVFDLLFHLEHLVVFLFE